MSSHVESLAATADQRVLKVRGEVLRAIRLFFADRDYLEVETPVRVPVPALELHIDAEPSGDRYLRTSPECYMKRMVCAGHGRIYELGPCFRRGETGDRHNPEYTMLEWYRAGVGYMEILAETKALIASVAEAVLGSTRLVYAGQEVELMPAWECLSVREVFRAHAGWDPVAEFDADRFDIDLLEKVEPRLPRNQPVVLKDYPAQVAALARLASGNAAVAERWELYIAGMELANAYGELTDAAEQRRRFDAWSAGRERRGAEAYPVDEAFLAALEDGMPDCAGVALGVDRLVMLMTDSPSIDMVRAFC